MTLRTRITCVAAVPVLVCAVVVVALTWYQRTSLTRTVSGIVRGEAEAWSRTVLRTVAGHLQSSHRRTARRLEHDLNLAREAMAKMGPVRFSDEMVAWEAVDQFSGERRQVALPKLHVGDTWLGQNHGVDVESPLVDELRRQTRDAVTVFQRMNEAGDMLRVCTSVVMADGRRGIGTYLPRVGPDGVENPVLKSVLAGTPFRGRGHQEDCRGH